MATPAPTAANAPGMIAPPPANRTSMNLQQYLDGIMSILQTRPPRPDEVAQLEQFFQQMSQMIQEETGEPMGQVDEGAAEQAGGAPPPGGPASSLMGPGQDYGSAPGTAPMPMYGGGPGR